MPFERLFLPLCIALVAGALSVLGFAPFHQPELTAIGLLALICLWHRSSKKQAAWIGFFYGLGLFGAGISWVQIPIHHFGGASWYLSALITLIFVVYLALFPALTGFVWSRLRALYSHPALSSLILLPSLWVFFEWLRGVLMTGFPWLFLGYPFINTPLAGFAPFLGVYGVAWLLICALSALYLLIHQRARLSTARLCSYLGIWTLCLVGGYLLSFIHFTQPVGTPQKVIMMQSNEPATIKWSADNLQRTLSDTVSMTQKVLAQQPRVIIWPETAIPATQLTVPFFLQKLQNTAIEHNLSIVTGIAWLNRHTQRIYNATLAIGPHTVSHYLKRQLVPFGEYQPIPEVFNPLFDAFSLPMSTFSEGPMIQPLMLIAGHPVAAFICYEIAYPGLVASTSTQAHWLLTSSDDSWFGRSFAASQQLQMAQMRALETEKPMAYATSSGITAFIGPDGTITARAPADQPETLTRMIQPMSGATPIVTIGMLTVICILLILIFIVGYITTNKKNK